MNRSVAGNRLGMVCLTVCLFLVSTPLFAQYYVESWENFESGYFPETLERTHKSTPENTRVVEYASLNNPELLRQPAPRECGRHGLLFHTEGQDRFLGVTSRIALLRNRLGEKGRALYQADFFLSAEKITNSTVSVLAIIGAGKTRSTTQETWTFYRLGILQNEKIFFSYSNQKPQPFVYLHEPLETLLTQPTGWHRLQIIFEGQKTILGCMDGKTTRFSPVVEGTIENLQAGIMVTSPADAPFTCIVDNLSIQWTPEDVPLPDSPWLHDSAAVPANSDAGAILASAPVSASPAPNNRFGEAVIAEWQTEPDEAWAQAYARQRPILLLFYAPKNLSSQLLFNQTLQTDELARGILRDFVCLKVDVNQLRGGMIAKKFGVFRVPTFLVLGPDGHPRAQMMYDKSINATALARELQKTLSP